MLSHLLRRIVIALPTLLAVTIIVFCLTRLTGDPATLQLGEHATPEAVRELREQWGLNDPIAVQYWRYLTGLFVGDLGQSLKYSRPVSTMIIERLGATGLLALASVTLSVIVAIPAGTLAAVKWGSFADAGIRLLVVMGQAFPRFYLGIVLMVVFSLLLRWLPTSGYGSLAHLILPALTLATPTTVLLTRLTRSSVLEVLQKDYVRTARSKGLNEGVVFSRHVLRNALMAPLTMIGIEAAGLFGGAVVVETVFGWPGLGRLAVYSVYTRDFPLIQGIVLVSCLLVIVANILVDALYLVIDPRIRGS